jgi:N6-adenosine-specific RNA methylase IME4
VRARSGSVVSGYQLLPPLTAEEYAALKADIAARGVMVPIELDEHGVILDGHHRSAIAAELGIEAPTVTRVGLSEAAKREHVLKLNLLRRQLGPIAWADAFRKLAAERGVRIGQGSRNDRTSANVAEVAAELGIAPRTARYRLHLSEALVDRPELAAAVDAGDMPAQRALSLARSDAVAATSRPVRLPDGRYDVLLADPPWRFDKGVVASRAIERIYPTLELADICAYRDAEGRAIADLARDAAVLFLWVPSAMLFDAAPAVLDAWGFRYVTHWVWCKDKIGMGYWARNQHEPLVVAVRGDMRPPPESLRPSSVIHAPRTTHSAKPAEIHERIERLWPDAARVELFAREARPGWASFGDQLEATA